MVKPSAHNRFIVGSIPTRSTMLQKGGEKMQGIISTKSKAAVEILKRQRNDISVSELETAVPLADSKLDWIISREGTYGGMRESPKYLAMLISEKIDEIRTMNLTLERSTA